jgi:hypothetical protein
LKIKQTPFDGIGRNLTVKNTLQIFHRQRLLAAKQRSLNDASRMR